MTQARPIRSLPSTCSGFVKLTGASDIRLARDAQKTRLRDKGQEGSTPMPSFEFLDAAMPEGSYFCEPEDRHPTFFLFFCYIYFGFYSCYL